MKQAVAFVFGLGMVRAGPAFLERQPEKRRGVGDVHGWPAILTPTDIRHPPRLSVIH
jgi:hypothetical protein